MSNQLKNFTASNIGDVQVTQGNSNRVSQGDNSFTVQGDNNQISQDSASETQLTQTDVIKLLAELEKLINESDLPLEIKEEVLTIVKAAKSATSKQEPKKQLALGNLEQATETLQNATDTVSAAKKFLETAKPMILKVAAWLGAAATGSFLAGL